MRSCFHLRQQDIAEPSESIPIDVLPSIGGGGQGNQNFLSQQPGGVDGVAAAVLGKALVRDQRGDTEQSILGCESSRRFHNRA